MLYKLPNMDKLLKKMPLCKYFYASKHIYARQMLNFRVKSRTPTTSWNSLWRKLTIESN